MNNVLLVQPQKEPFPMAFAALQVHWKAMATMLKYLTVLPQIKQK